MVVDSDRSQFPFDFGKPCVQRGALFEQSHDPIPRRVEPFALLGAENARRNRVNAANGERLTLFVQGRERQDGLGFALLGTREHNIIDLRFGTYPFNNPNRPSPQDVGYYATLEKIALNRLND